MARVLMAGPEFHCYTANLKKAFEVQGDSVDLILYSIYAGPIHRWQDRKRVVNFNAEIVSSVATGSYDKVIMVRGADVFDETLEMLKRKGVKLVLFLQDTLACSGNASAQLKYYDKVLLFDEVDLALLRKQGIAAEYYGSPVSIENYFPIPSIEKDVDLCFVGNLFDERVAILEHLIESLPDKRIVVVGRYIPLSQPAKWGRFYKYYVKGYCEYFKCKHMDYAEINRLYNRSKICLNLQNRQSVYSCSYRTLEIMAAKAFQISSPNPLMERLVDEAGVVLFREAAELTELVNTYLKKSAEREMYAAKGYGYALKNSYQEKMRMFSA